MYLGNLYSRLTIRLNEELFSFISQRADSLHISVSHYIRMLIEKDYINCTFGKENQ